MKKLLKAFLTIFLFSSITAYSQTTRVAAGKYNSDPIVYTSTGTDALIKKLTDRVTLLETQVQELRAAQRNIILEGATLYPGKNVDTIKINAVWDKRIDSTVIAHQSLNTTVWRRGKTIDSLIVDYNSYKTTINIGMTAAANKIVVINNDISILKQWIDKLKNALCEN
jgi:hypothetical protein